MYSSIAFSIVHHMQILFIQCKDIFIRSLKYDTNILWMKTANYGSFMSCGFTPSRLILSYLLHIVLVPPCNLILYPKYSMCNLLLQKHTWSLNTVRWRFSRWQKIPSKWCGGPPKLNSWSVSSSLSTEFIMLHSNQIMAYPLVLNFCGSKFSQIWTCLQNYFSENFGIMVLAY